MRWHPEGNPEVVQWSYCDEDTYKFSVECSQVVGDQETIYTIVSMENGQNVDVYGASQEEGAILITFDSHGGENQKFVLKKVDSASGGAEVYFIGCLHSQMVWDIYGGSTENGGQVIQYEQHGGPNQQFVLENIEGDIYRIRAHHSGKYLTTQWTQYQGANHF